MELVRAHSSDSPDGFSDSAELETAREVDEDAPGWNLSELLLCRPCTEVDEPRQGTACAVCRKPWHDGPGDHSRRCRRCEFLAFVAVCACDLESG